MSRDLVLTTVTAMLADRGFTNPIKLDQKESPFDQGLFFEKAASDISTENSNGRLYVYYPVDDKVNIETFKGFLAFLLKWQISHAILIYTGSLTPSVKEALKNKEPRIEAFNYLNMCYNPTRHVYNHKATLVVGAELLEVKSKVGDLRFCHHVYESDPVCRWHDFKAGDLIRITREHEVVYKYVVP